MSSLKDKIKQAVQKLKGASTNEVLDTVSTVLDVIDNLNRFNVSAKGKRVITAVTSVVRYGSSMVRE